jgi:hypothetical protein
MKNKLVFLGAVAFLSLIQAAEQAQLPAPYREFKGSYTIYSGGLDDQQAPTKNDRKLSLIIEGAAAKNIFDAMPPDDKQTCITEKGARSRSKEKVWCTFSPSDRYICYFGFDLRTGKNISGGIC